MLCLARRKDQSICIGKSVIITVIEVRSGNNVRLAVEAPKVLPVHRGEVVLANAAQQDGEELTTHAASEILSRLQPKQRLALLKQLLDDEVCLGCGCRPLRCQCHGGSGLLLPAMAGAAS